MVHPHGGPGLASRFVDVGKGGRSLDRVAACAGLVVLRKRHFSLLKAFISAQHLYARLIPGVQRRVDLVLPVHRTCIYPLTSLFKSIKC